MSDVTEDDAMESSENIHLFTEISCLFFGSTFWLFLRQWLKNWIQILGYEYLFFLRLTSFGTTHRSRLLSPRQIRSFALCVATQFDTFFFRCYLPRQHRILRLSKMNAISSTLKRLRCGFLLTQRWPICLATHLTSKVCNVMTVIAIVSMVLSQSCIQSRGFNGRYELFGRWTFSQIDFYLLLDFHFDLDLNLCFYSFQFIAIHFNWFQFKLIKFWAFVSRNIWHWIKNPTNFQLSHIINRYSIILLFKIKR